jgi:hypothetical protein
MKVGLLFMKMSTIKTVLLISIFSLNALFIQAQVKGQWKYKDELYSYLQKPSDSVFIKDRADQELLLVTSCTNTEVRYHSITRSGELVQISIKSKIFLPSLHTVQLSDTIYKTVDKKKVFDSVRVTNNIDSTYAYGVYGKVPATEISSFVVLRNYKKITIPKNAYTDLYNLYYCTDQKLPEVYITKDNKYLFVYLHGGNGAEQYSVKLIFDKNGYVTRIVNKHPCLKDYDFLDGFGDCE